jgi:hypothetical protein
MPLYQIIWVSLFLALVGCGKSSTTTGLASTTPTTGSATTTTGGLTSGSTVLPAVNSISGGATCPMISLTAPTAAFAVRVYSLWPGAQTWNRLDTGTCQTNVVSSTAVACSVTVPEAQLHYSKIYFEVYALNGSSQCDVIYFEPYSYLASTNVAFVPGWGTSSTATDCSKPYEHPECWNGAGKALVPGFPRNNRVFHSIGDLTYPQWCSGTMVESANISQNGYVTNRWMTNDLVLSRSADATPLGAGDGYKANSMVDWRWTCVNQYDDVRYSIKMTLTDSNTDGTGPDTIPSWTGAVP